MEENFLTGVVHNALYMPKGKNRRRFEKSEGLFGKCSKKFRILLPKWPFNVSRRIFPKKNFRNLVFSLTLRRKDSTVVVKLNSTYPRGLFGGGIFTKEYIVIVNCDQKLFRCCCQNCNSTCSN